VRCIYHGLEFDGSGACVHNPHGNGRIPPAARARSYPVIERHGQIWVWMGEKESDPARLPDYHFLEAGEGKLLSVQDHLIMDAGIDLIVENLLDLSHVSFLHEGLLGSSATVAADIMLEQGERELTVRRWMPGVPSPELFDIVLPRKGELIDMWFDMRWQAPGALTNDVGATSPGGDRQRGYRIQGAHILTPQTATSTHYHFAAALHLPPDHDHTRNAAIGPELSRIRRYAFEAQDAPIIQAQQRTILNAAPEVLTPILLDIDAGPVRYRRMMAALLTEEHSV